MPSTARPSRCRRPTRLFFIALRYEHESERPILRVIRYFGRGKLASARLSDSLLTAERSTASPSLNASFHRAPLHVLPRDVLARRAVTAKRFPKRFAVPSSCSRSQRIRFLSRHKRSAPRHSSNISRDPLSPRQAAIYLPSAARLCLVHSIPCAAESAPRAKTGSAHFRQGCRSL